MLLLLLLVSATAADFYCCCCRCLLPACCCFVLLLLLSAADLQQPVVCLCPSLPFGCLLALVCLLMFCGVSVCLELSFEARACCSSSSSSSSGSGVSFRVYRCLSLLLSPPMSLLFVNISSYCVYIKFGAVCISLDLRSTVSSFLSPLSLFLSLFLSLLMPPSLFVL